MEKHLLSGNEAIARGAYEAGVRVCSAYPGTPSTEIFENLPQYRDALYCDMGSGWNYSWYRGESGKHVDIIGIPWPFSHNWLVFRK